MSPDCSKVWTRKHIRSCFTLTFITGPLKQHKAQVLFDKERALLPATQPIIEGKLEAKRIERKMDKLTKEIRELRRKHEEEIRVLNQYHGELVARRNICLNRKTQERSSFVRACPQEECRGFLSTQWKCGICEKWTCPTCHVIKGYTRDAPHTCNPDDVATAALIATDTKPCPKCATGIFKIDGCDQMWCTQCHTAFSWRTGRIENHIHNPHFFEWQRRTGGGQAPRNPNDVQCGRALDNYLYESFSRLIRIYYPNATNRVDVLERLDRTIRGGIHILRVERPDPVNYANRHEDMRVQYLMNNISEAAMRRELEKDDKKHHKQQELNDIYTLLINTITDILYRFLDELENNKADIRWRSCIDTTTLDEEYAIIRYANECLADVAHTYSCARVLISSPLWIVRGKDRIREHLAALERQKAGPPPAEIVVENSNNEK
jgi:hypothetical protein